MALILNYAGRINVITGPNYSGKSVYVKQVSCKMVIIRQNLEQRCISDAHMIGRNEQDRKISRPEDII